MKHELFRDGSCRAPHKSAAMSESHRVWMLIWEYAAVCGNGREPFEVDEVVPAICSALSASEREARSHATFLLHQLQRLPEGSRYFELEGNAVVPLDEYVLAPKDSEAAAKTYPFEL